jgi:cell division protein FtsB
MSQTFVAVVAVVLEQTSLLIPRHDGEVQVDESQILEVRYIGLLAWFQVSSVRGMKQKNGVL